MTGKPVLSPELDPLTLGALPARDLWNPVIPDRSLQTHIQLEGHADPDFRLAAWERLRPDVFSLRRNADVAAREALDRTQRLDVLANPYNYSVGSSTELEKVVQQASATELYYAGKEIMTVSLAAKGLWTAALSEMDDAVDRYVGVLNTYVDEAPEDLWVNVSPYYYRDKPRRFALLTGFFKVYKEYNNDERPEGEKLRIPWIKPIIMGKRNRPGIAGKTQTVLGLYLQQPTS